MGPDGDLVVKRLARGSRCFVVWMDEGAVGGYGWLSTGPEWVGELELEIKPKPGEGYIWNCVTVAEHRRKGIFHSLLVGISEVARKEGLQRLWMGSVAIPAEKAVGPSGFKPVLHFDTWRFAGLHAMRVAVGSNTALASDALQILAVGPGLHLRRGRVRRH
jgi:GNAT superfamily N-acetyltransferase